MICGVYGVLGIFLIAAAGTRQLDLLHDLVERRAFSDHGVQVIYDSREYGHLVGDVPALLVAGMLWLLSPTNKVAIKATG